MPTFLPRDFPYTCQFASADKALLWCGYHGLVVGTLQAGAPRGLAYAPVERVEPWRNLSSADVSALAGVLDVVGGLHTVYLRAAPSALAPRYRYRVGVAVLYVDRTWSRVEVEVDLDEPDVSEAFHLAVDTCWGLVDDPPHGPVETLIAWDAVPLEDSP